MSVSVESLKECFLIYREISEDIELMSTRLEIMNSKILSPHTTHLTGMPSAKGGIFDNLGENVSKNTDLENQIKKKSEQAYLIYKSIDNTILKLQGKGSAKKRAVLQARYLDLLKWDDVTEYVFLSEIDFLDREESYLRRTHKIHQAAMNDLSKLLTPEDLETFIIV